MNENAIVLDALCEELKQLDQSIVGNPEIVDAAVHALDGQLRLVAEVHTDEGAHPLIAHVHVLAEIGEPGQVLDACVLGMHKDREEALRDAARHWILAAGAPILSMLRAKPLLDAEHFCGTEPWGVHGCHGFVGPLIARFFPNQEDLQPMATAPLFEDVSELAPAGTIHMAKSTVDSQHGKWKRSLEIDGHSVSHVNHNWQHDLPVPSQPCIGSRFAVFHYADRETDVESRAAEQTAIDNTIRCYLDVFQTTPDMDFDAAMTQVERQGVESDLVHRVGVFAPLAFGRFLFAEMGVTFSPEYTLVQSDGIQEKRRLMQEPTFARSTATVGELLSSPELCESCKQMALLGPELLSWDNCLARPFVLPIGPDLDDPILPPMILHRTDRLDRAVPHPLVQDQSGRRVVRRSIGLPVALRFKRIECVTDLLLDRVSRLHGRVGLQQRCHQSGGCQGRNDEDGQYEETDCCRDLEPAEGTEGHANAGRRQQQRP